MDMGEAGATMGRGGQNNEDVEVRAGPLEEGTFHRLSAGKEAASAGGGGGGWEKFPKGKRHCQ